MATSTNRKGDLWQVPWGPCASPWRAAGVGCRGMGSRLPWGGCAVACAHRSSAACYGTAVTAAEAVTPFYLPLSGRDVRLLRCYGSFQLKRKNKYMYTNEVGHPVTPSQRNSATHHRRKICGSSGKWSTSTRVALATTHPRPHDGDARALGGGARAGIGLWLGQSDSGSRGVGS